MIGFKSKLAFVAATVGLMLGCSIPAQADDDDNWRRYRKFYRNQGRHLGWRNRPYYGAAYPYPYSPYYVSPYASPYPGYVYSPYNNPYPRRDGVSTAVRILRGLGM
ncbi:MAG: hypothetical protein K2X29_10160 [Candidatus Obscuribacterales bacterium]|nr:hypothetical protein [Candidatus Obscuribacterales bacterium]